jgi:hypothetical protein
MAHKDELKTEAIRLRTEERMGIKPIARMLGISRSTASVWLRDFTLTNDERRVKISAGRMVGAQSTKHPQGLDRVRSVGFDAVGLALKKAWIISEQHECCNRCKNHEWLGEPIPLELEHKDGNRKNNTRDNLECLCPNCHSRTPFYRSRNTKSSRRVVTDTELLAALMEEENIARALVRVGLTPRGDSYTRAKRLLEVRQ